MFLIPKETIRLKCGKNENDQITPAIVDQTLHQFDDDFELEFWASKHSILTLKMVFCTE